MRFPFGHCPIRLASFHEALVITAMPGLLAAAETGHVAQNLRVFGRELVGSRDHGVGTRRIVRREGDGRQRRLLVRTE